VTRRYLDGVKGAELPEGTREAFVEMLTHDAVVVQIPLLDGSEDTEIERALMVFNQHNKDRQNPHYLVMEEEPSKDALVEKMVRALLAAAVDDETKREMGMEDELERIFQENASAKTTAAEAVKIADEERRQKEAANKRAEEERKQKEAAIARVAELEAMLKKLKGE
jgi:hypothetical protein